MSGCGIECSYLDCVGDDDDDDEYLDGDDEYSNLSGISLDWSVFTFVGAPVSAVVVFDVIFICSASFPCALNLALKNDWFEKSVINQE